MPMHGPNKRYRKSLVALPQVLNFFCSCNFRRVDLLLGNKLDTAFKFF